jgi:uncharacterized protein (TIGR00375 family)
LSIIIKLDKKYFVNMRYIADLHIHSKYSRACSSRLELENIERWCRIKGVDIVASADFTHPKWFAELKSKLKLAKNGLYELAEKSPSSPPLKKREEGGLRPVYFLLSTEISCIYSKGGKVRRLHILIFAPTLETVAKINKKLGEIGNLASDGRPILGLDAKELLKIVLEIDENCLIIPAHAWTPWFAIFGSKSGFDSLEECFEELTPHIHAIETGLSSDPAMNWRLSKLDDIVLVSHSDAHSPENIGREADVFEIADGKNFYKEISRIIKEKDKEKFLHTIEFYPEEGMYHFDGHRDCKIRFSPEETRRHKGICPKCGRPVTVGVMSRIEELADRLTDEKPKNFIPYKSLVGLDDVVAEALGVFGRRTKSVMNEYQNLVAKGKSEFNILLNLSYDDLSKITLPEIVEGVKRNREGKVFIDPGYDGTYGTVRLFSDKEKKRIEQATLF